MSNESIKPVDYERRLESIDKQILDQHLEEFFRRWAPNDRDLVGYFDRDFYNLIRLIYQDAVRPYNEMTKNLLQSMAPLSILPMAPK